MAQNDQHTVIRTQLYKEYASMMLEVRGAADFYGKTTFVGLLVA
jgi:hypothetical protein